jgi:MFS family permease
VHEETAVPLIATHRLSAFHPTAGEEPTERVSRGWTARFTLVWLGFWAAQFVPIQLTLPDALERIDPLGKVRDFSLITGVSAVVALLTLPLCGALCDRTRSRWGRRRVWMAGGILATAAGLLLTGVQTTPSGLGLAWLCATVGISAATAGLTATVADQVPQHQRGMISGAMNAPQALGVMAGIAVVSVFGLNTAETCLVLAVTLLLCGAPFVLRYRDTTPSSVARQATPQLVVRGTEMDRNLTDFRWALASRLLVNLTNSLGVCYLLYFLTDEVHATDPTAALLLLTVIYVAGMLTTCLIGGVVSDRLDRRRIFACAAAIMQGIAALALALVPTLEVAMSGAALFGAGLGAYMAVDQVLVTAVLPDAGSRAKHLGVLNVAALVPQAFAPLAAGVVITYLGGYAALYLITAVTAALGGIVVFGIRVIR